MRAVTRFTRILQAVASSSTRALSLAELARACELDKASVLRIARALAEEGWLVPVEGGRWSLGTEAWIVGRRAAPRLQALVASARPRLARLAHQTEDTVYLTVRSGTDVVFLDRVIGRHPVRASIEPGSRQPLVLGCSGTAWLASLPPPEADALVDELGQRMQALAVSRPSFEQKLEQARRRGYAFTTGTRLFGVPAVGMIARDAEGAPLACVTVSANADRLPAARVQLLLPLLQRCVKNIERAMRSA